MAKSWYWIISPSYFLSVISDCQNQVTQIGKAIVQIKEVQDQTAPKSWVWSGTIFLLHFSGNDFLITIGCIGPGYQLEDSILEIQHLNS